MADSTMRFIIEAKDGATIAIKQATAATEKLGDSVSKVGSKMASAGNQASAFGKHAQDAFSVALGFNIGNAFMEIASRAKEAALYVLNFGKEVEHLVNMTKTTGLGQPEWEGLNLVLRDAGLPTESLGVAFRELNKKLAANDEMLRIIAPNAKTTWEAFLRIADAVKAAGDAQTQTAIASETLGSRTGYALLPALQLGSAAFLEGKDAAVAYGIALTEAQTKTSLLADAAMDDLGNRWLGAWRQTAANLQGALVPMLEGLNKLFESQRRITQERIDFEKIALGTDDWIGGSDVATGLLSAHGDIAKAVEQFRAAYKKEEIDLSKPYAKAAGEIERMTKDLRELSSVTAAMNLRGIGKDPYADLERARIEAEAKERGRLVMELRHPTPVVVQPIGKDAAEETVSAWSDAFSDISMMASQNFGMAFADIAMHTRSAADAFRMAWQSAIGTIVQQLASMFIRQTVFSPAGPFGALFGMAAATEATPITINVSSIDARTGLESLVSERGALNMANMRLVQLRASGVLL